MHAIIIALAGIACMSGLWLIAWMLWQLPRPDRARVPTPQAPAPTMTTVSHDVTPRSVAPQSHPVVRERPPQPAPRDNYENDKAKTAFFERRPKPEAPNVGGTEVVPAVNPVQAKPPSAAGLARRKPPPPPPRSQT